MAVILEEGIPRRIFLYWASGFDTAPRIVQVCVASWRQHNPDWEVIQLDDENLGSWLGDENGGLGALLEHVPIQKRSDLIRLALLSKHGGFWADATVFCAQPLDEVLGCSARRAFVVVSGAPGGNRFLESYFIGSSPGGHFVRAWFQATRAYLETVHKAMTRPTQKRWAKRFPFLLSSPIGTLFWTIPPIARKTGYPYLIPHYLANRLIILNPVLWWAFSRAQRIVVGQALRFERRENGLQAMTELFNQGVFPMWKLTWREHLTPDFWQGVFELVQQDPPD